MLGGVEYVDNEETQLRPGAYKAYLVTLVTFCGDSDSGPLKGGLSGPNRRLGPGTIQFTATDASGGFTTILIGLIPCDTLHLLEYKEPGGGGGGEVNS